LKPVVAIYSTFLQRAYDQILHDVCLESLPVIFAVDRGGIVGEDGPTHHGLFDLSYLRSLPNMTVMAPKDENELRRMMVTAIHHSTGPIAFRYPRGCGSGVALDAEITTLEIGRGEILFDGQDVLILAIGSTVASAVDARRILSEKGIDATVVNCRFVKPLDAELICGLAEKISHILTVEENVLQGGFGSAVLEMLSDHGILNRNISVKRLGIKDRFVEHGSTRTLRARYGLDAEGIAAAVLSMRQNHPA
jgi:1-deoxy-D-xylulose-5-phosphate synthase